MRIKNVWLVSAVAALAFSASPVAQDALRESSHAAAAGLVHVLTNDPSGNAVLQFRRAANGRLALADRRFTGGRGGTGNGVGNLDPLGSQDSLISNGDGSRLIAVNAGSDEISVLGVTSKGLTLLDTARSGGDFPNSVALSGDLVYVLNAHGTPNVTGFRLDAAGNLRPLAGSTRALPGGVNAAPHDIRFSPDGTRLIVTEEGPNQIDVFDIGNDGLIAAATTQPSAGAVPFGMAFGRGDVLVVTEAASSSASSYQLTSANTLTVISPAVANGQAASCWIALATRGQAFVSNTGSATLSAYQVGADGQLTLVNATAAKTGDGSGPIDAALSSDNRFLYVVDSALGKVLIYRVDGNTLAAAGSVPRLPKTIQGIVAR